MSQVYYTPLKDYGIIQFTGEAVDKFLQGQLTCDINDVKENMSAYGAYCNIKGKVQGVFRVFMLDGHYCLRLPKSILPKIIQELGLYAKFSKISVTDISDNYQLFGLILDSTQYPFHPELTLESTPLAVQSVQNHSFIAIEQTALCFEYYCPKTESPLFEALEHQVCHQDTWLALQVQAGVTDVFDTTYEKFFPHHINLHDRGAISYTKGCYRGQEIVARMQHRGTIKRHTYHYWCKDTSVEATPGLSVGCQNERFDNPGYIVQSAKSDRGIECLVETLDTIADTEVLWLGHPENRLEKA